MRTNRTQAITVARLYGEDPRKVVGWLYVWDTEELSIRCSDKTSEKTIVFRFIDPPVDLARYSRRFRANKRVRDRLAATKPLPF